MLTIKFAVGLLTGSLAMLADAVDSSLDAVANLIAMLMTRIAGRPADADHPYGHRRFETLAAMLVGGLLLLAAWELVQNSVTRLVSGEVPELTVANFAVMVVAFGVNIVLYIYQQRASQRFRSEALQASAADKRNDIMVSCTVFVSLVVVELGLGWVDAAAALVVVALTGRTAFNVVRNAASVLVDCAALDAGAVQAIAETVPGVQQIMRVRSRGPADDVHLDMDVRVAPPTTTAHCAAIAGEMRARLRDHFDGLSDVQVNFLPARSVPGDTPDYALIARAQADALGLGVHEVIAARTDAGLALEMHVEVAPAQTVGEAHEIVSQFEARLREAIPDLARVVTHIEPAYTAEALDAGANAHKLARCALLCAERLFPDNDWHDCNICSVDERSYALSMHCHVAPEMPLEAAHRLAETVEMRVRAEIPALERVTIHTEPHDHD
ncbi:MAG: cation-efflux pump [Anaerolineae bacterium]|nr:cation-efflux pump [Anaerolineae bacterium]